MIHFKYSNDSWVFSTAVLDLFGKLYLEDGADSIPLALSSIKILKNY